MFNSSKIISTSQKDDPFCNTIDSQSSESKKFDEYDVKIPKIIMQTWKDKNIPDKWKSSPESIKKHMPGWKYVLLTDKDNRKFVKKHFPDFLKYYDNFPYNIMRCDSIRYLWMYIHGGVYMDLDFEVLKPLDEFFTSNADVYLINSSNVGSYLTNSFMACKPRCKLWLDVIEAMKNPGLSWYHMGRHMIVMNVSGPIMLTYAVARSKIVYATLPTKLFLPCSVCDIGNKKKIEGSYLKQLEGSSWVTYDTKFYNFFMCNWRYLLCFLGILIVFILLVLIFRNFFIY